MWEQYQEDFADFTEAIFKTCDRIATYNLRALLRHQGVWVNKRATITQSLYDTLCEEDQTEWTKEEVLDHINTNRFFASFKLNRIFVGPSIFTNPPLPGEVGLLPYTMSYSENTRDAEPDELEAPVKLDELEAPVELDEPEAPLLTLEVPQKL